MFLLGLAIVAIAAPLAAGYDKELEKIDAEKILGDDALFDEYIACFLDKGPCNVEYSNEAKKILPELVAEACGKCTPIQKGITRKLVNALYEKRPKEALEFNKKYDPKGEYQANFIAFLQAKDD